MADITYIPIRQLYPHPDNPRKELGDLSELAASIKESAAKLAMTTAMRSSYAERSMANDRPCKV